MSETMSSEPAGPLSSEVYLVHPNRNPRQPHYAQPTSQQRPGWVAFRKEPTDICFECFALGHKKPNCPYLAKTFYDANFREVVKRNYHQLTRQQKEYLRAIARSPAFALTQNEGNALMSSPTTPPGSQSVVSKSTSTVGTHPAAPKNAAPQQPVQSKN